MEYPTKSNTPMNMQDGGEKKMPSHIEIADHAFVEFIQMGHTEMVEAFKYLQKKLCDTRFEQNQNMKADLESHACDVKAHAEGTDVIASAL